MEEGSLSFLTSYFAAVQLSMPASAAFSGVFLTEEIEWVLWLQVSTGSRPSGHCITGSSRLSSSYLLPKSTSKKRKPAGVPHAAERNVFELLSFSVLQLLQRL